MLRSLGELRFKLLGCVAQLVQQGFERRGLPRRELGVALVHGFKPADRGRARCGVIMIHAERVAHWARRQKPDLLPLRNDAGKSSLACNGFRAGPNTTFRQVPAPARLCPPLTTIRRLPRDCPPLSKIWDYAALPA